MRQGEATISAAAAANLPNTVQRLVQLYEATDRPAQAAEWKQKLAEFEPREASVPASPDFFRCCPDIWARGDARPPSKGHSSQPRSSQKVTRATRKKPSSPPLRPLCSLLYSYPCNSSPRAQVLSFPCNHGNSFNSCNFWAAAPPLVPLSLRIRTPCTGFLPPYVTYVTHVTYLT